MKPKNIIFLSLMTTVFIIGQSMPIQIGEPLDVFLGVLFYSLAGYICIAYIYFLTSLNIIINLPYFLNAGPIFKESLIAFDSEYAFIVNTIPDWLFTIFFISMMYVGVTISIISCHFLIKKLHLHKGLCSIH